MKRAIVLGWIVSLGGTALWIYGYFVAGHAPFLDWSAYAPRMIAEFLPNRESEVGMVLAIVGSVPVYWAMFRDWRLEAHSPVVGHAEGPERAAQHRDRD